jgi:hypothetical protein
VVQLTQLTIYIAEGDRWQHQQLYHALIEVARQQKMAGITIARAVVGIGSSGKIRTANILALSVDLPLVVTLIDRPEKIYGFLATAQTMVRSGLIALQTVEVLEPILRN